MVAITFRTDGAWGVGTGVDLDAGQIDTNFWNLKAAVEATMAAIPAAAVGISDFGVTGNLMTVIMTDASTRGPFTLPSVPWVFREAWAPATAYSIGDVVNVGSSAYVVQYAHTSASTFDPAAQISGNNLYYNFLTLTAAVTPYMEISTTTYVLDADDAGKYLRCTHASGCEVTIPDSATLAAGVDAEWNFRQCAGNITFVVASGGSATISGISGYGAGTDLIGATCTLKMWDDDEFDLFGLLAIL